MVAEVHRSETKKTSRRGTLLADLARMTADAESGKLEGMAYVGYRKDKSIETYLSGSVKDDMFRTIGGIRVLEARLLDEVK